MNPIYSIICAVGIVIALGFALGFLDRKAFQPRWLVMGGVLMVVSDFALTMGYGLIPDFLGGDWNWTGKALALGVTVIAIAALRLRWADLGFTFRQNREGRTVTWIVAAVLVALFTIPALLSSPDPHTLEDVAFQASMPGIEEEPFYRGLLLFVLASAFAGRWRFAGIEWHWGSLLSCVAFGLGHALGWGDGGLEFDPMTFAVTGIPALLLVWLRERTGSLLLPVVLHNYANVISYFV